MIPTTHVDGKFSRVDFSNLTLFFSYQTLIGFRVGDRKIVRQNLWGPTTASHIKSIGAAEQVGAEEFTALFTQLTGGL